MHESAVTANIGKAAPVAAFRAIIPCECSHRGIEPVRPLLLVRRPVKFVTL